jgi:peptide/nickel transport system permease protein
VQSALFRFIARRTLRAMLLVLAAASAAMVLVHLAPGGPFAGFDVDPVVAAAERERLGLDRPFVQQYFAWLLRVAAGDFGDSIRFHRPVGALLAERVGNTLLLGAAALAIAIGVGLPAGVLTGSAPRSPVSRPLRAASLLLIATPPLVTALVLLVVAARTGWLPAGGYGGASAAGSLQQLGDILRHLPMPALALGLPIAAALERLQSRAIREALGDPSVAAARARGVSVRRATWVHAFRLSAPPVLGVLGIVIGTVLSGSFIVEIVMSWPGLGRLMYDALLARDMYLAAGCASAAALFLAIGILAADIALAVLDPRTAAAA